MYAGWWIRQAIWRAVADMEKTIRLPVNMQDTLRKINAARDQIFSATEREPDVEDIALLTDISTEKIIKLAWIPEEPVSSEEYQEEVATIPDPNIPSPEDLCIQSSLEKQIRQLLAGLNTRMTDIMSMRFGIDQDAHTLEEIGQCYGVTRERIRQIEFKALKLLRYPDRSRHLRDYL